MNLCLIPASRIGRFVAACVLPLLSLSAFASSTWTNLGNGNGSVAGATPCTTTATSNVGVGNVLTCVAQGGVSLSADAFSTNNGAASTTGTVFAAAALYNWGSTAGLGVVNASENHSVYMQKIIEAAWQNRDLLKEVATQKTINEVIELLDKGKIRE